MDGMDWAASAMVAARTRLDIATENLANVSTRGFRKFEARGSLGATGVTIARTRSGAHGALERTGRDLDWAIVGDGGFALRAEDGTLVPSRNGAFVRDRFGHLRDDRGAVLQGRHGALRFPEGAALETDGSVRLNGSVIDRIALARGSTVRTGFLETANTDAVSEMLDVLAAQRSFEGAQKVASAIDDTRKKSVNDLARVQ